MSKVHMKKSLTLFMVVVMLASIVQIGVIKHASASTMDVWTETSFINVFRDNVKTVGAKTTIDWVAAKNEYESAQILFRADTGFTINSVSFSNLTSGGHTINSSNLTYKFVDYLSMSTDTNGLTNRIRSAPDDFPEYLLNESSIAVSANTTQPIWVTVYIPKTAEPETYTGTATINTSLGNYNVNIQIEVNDVQIPDSSESELDLFFWQALAGWYDFADSKDQIKKAYGYDRYTTEWWDLMDKFANLDKINRVNHLIVPMVHLLADGGTTESSGGVYTFNWSRFDEFVQFFIDRGAVKRLVGAHLGVRSNDGGYGAYLINHDNGQSIKMQVEASSAEADNWFTQFLPALKAHLISKGWYDIWYQSIGDEPASQAKVDDWLTIWDYMDTYMPETKILEAVYVESAYTQLVGKLDIWVPAEQIYQGRTTYFEARRNAGDELWFYTFNFPQGNYMNRFVQQPVWFNRSLLWLVYQWNMDGFLHWGMNAWHHSFNQPFGDAYSIYPDPDNADIIGSIRLEGVRDGAEEFELLKILEVINPGLAENFVDNVVLSGNVYTTDTDYLKEQRDDLVRAAAGVALIPKPTVELFSDDFEDGNANGWTTINGTWSVTADGTQVYKQSSTSGEALAHAGDNAWTNYSVEAKIKLYDFDSADATGILARYTDSSNYYMLRLAKSGTSGSVQLYKKVGGSFTLLDSENLTINKNEWYTLKLDVERNHLIGYVNGVERVNVRDGSLSNGRIGVRSYTESFAVDDVIVDGEGISPTPTPTPTVTPTPTPTPTPTATPTPTPTPTPTFSDDFEDGNSTGWTQESGTWSVVTDGTLVYKQSSTSGEAVSHVGNSAWTDYSVEAKLKLYDLDNGDATGILARYTDNNNYYLFRLGKSGGVGLVQLYKKVGGSFILLDDANLTINTNEWYTLKLELEGTELKGYVNGVERVSDTDSSHGSGKIGVRSINSSFAIDDLTVIP